MRRAPLLLVLTLCACGYQLAQGGALAHGAQALRVAEVKNRTALAEAGGIFAAALRDQLAERGRLAGESSAEPLLEAELLAVRSVPSAFGAQAAPAFRVEADLRLRLRSTDGAELYQDAGTLGEDYLEGVDVLGTEANRRAALRRLATEMAREAVERMEIAARLQ